MLVQFIRCEIWDVENLLDCVNSNHYILTYCDSCPPGVSVERFARVTQIARAWKL